MSMHSSVPVTLSAALLSMLAITPAMAQQSQNQIPPEHYQSARQNEASSTEDETRRRRENGVHYQSMREKRDAALAAQKGEKATTRKSAQEVPALYPDATRQAPEETASRSGLKDLQKLREQYEAQDYAGAIAGADKIANAASANAYEKSMAYQIAGTAAGQNGDDAAARQYFEKALAANGLDNNNHYTVMYNLAVVEYGMDQYADALATLDRFLSETKSSTPDQLNLRGALLSNLERYDEAAKLYTELMAQHPDDKRFLMNAVAAYQQADKFDQAAALLSDAQKKGQLTEPGQYRALYVTYINADKLKEAVAVIDDGLAKGILQPGPDLAKDYMVLGQKAYYAEDDATAIEMYKRAAPLAADGEAALNLAKVYAETGKSAEARAAAQQALAKGVKNPAEANKLIGGK